MYNSFLINLINFWAAKRPYSYSMVIFDLQFPPHVLKQAEPRPITFWNVSQHIYKHLRSLIQTDFHLNVGFYDNVFNLKDTALKERFVILTDEKLSRMWLLMNQYDGLTWHINIRSPIASLMFERANASTMNRSFFSLGVLLLRKHGQQATREWQSARNSPTIVTTHHTAFNFTQALLVLKNHWWCALTCRDVLGKEGIFAKNHNK